MHHAHKRIMHCTANHNKHSQKPIGTSLIAPPPAPTIGNACGRVSANHIEENWLFAQSLYLLAAGEFFFSELAAPSDLRQILRGLQAQAQLHRFDMRSCRRCLFLNVPQTKPFTWGERDARRLFTVLVPLDASQSSTKV